MRDVKQLEKLILGNRQWLEPWEATHPFGPGPLNVRSMVRELIKSSKKLHGLGFVIEVDGQVVGQLNVANILRGSVSSAILGYWIAPQVAGRGVTPTSVALVIDYLFNRLGLHRVEIDIRPENTASLRVVEKLGLRYEGLKQRYIHINGAWRDHYIFAITYEEISDGLLNRWLQKEVPNLKYPWQND